MKAHHRDSKIVLTGNDLSLPDVAAVAIDHAAVDISPDSREQVQACRQAIERMLTSGTPAYGITTGFGALQDRNIASEDLDALQENIVLSHAAGIGPEMSPDQMRAMMMLRANALAKGFSGVRTEVIDLLIDMLNAGLTPVAPTRGSVGSSGDLAPLAHMALVLIGRGRARIGGREMSGSAALQEAGLTPLRLKAKEGLALTNGTQFMTGLGALALWHARRLAQLADVSLAMVTEALYGKSAAFAAEAIAARPHPGQITVAANWRRLTQGSAQIDSTEGSNALLLQDAYSIRCAPQVHGAARDGMEFATRVLEIEMNSVTDNPLISTATSQIYSAGNFHGEPVGMVLDLLSIVTAELGSISERRTARLLDQRDNRGLPPFLTTNSGLNSGLMVAQYTAAALVSENKSLAHPAIVDSVPTSANQEDHNSMGSISALHATDIVRNVTWVLAVELLCAMQALSLRGASGLGAGTRAAYDAVREIAEPVVSDRELGPDIAAVAAGISSGSILQRVESAVGPLD